jgi:DNA-binding winged helix-turn-helix (wHTH) protein
MSSTLQWRFEPFRLDPVNACLWRGDRMLALRPKPFAVLAYLVSHAGQLVTKEALFEAIWPETVVSDTVLKACIRQVRQVLGDTARTSQFILTVHRRGYRFIAPVTEVNQTPDIPIEPVAPLATDDVPALAQPSARRTSGTLIDRDADRKNWRSGSISAPTAIRYSSSVWSSISWHRGY